MTKTLVLSNLEHYKKEDSICCWKFMYEQIEQQLFLSVLSLDGNRLNVQLEKTKDIIKGAFDRTIKYAAIELEDSKKEEEATIHI